MSLYFSAKSYYISFRLLEVFVLRLRFKVSSRVGFIIFVSCTRYVFTECRNHFDIDRMNYILVYFLCCIALYFFEIADSGQEYVTLMRLNKIETRLVVR